MRISEDEWTMLEALAARRGISASDYVRMSIRLGHEAEFSAETKRAPRRGKGAK